MIKIGVNFPKENVKLPSKWNKITKSIYNNEKNYAILTGKINNIIVVDLDNKDPEFTALKWFEENSCDNYIIIDDDKSLNDLPKEMKENLILTSPLIGLTKNLIK